MASYGFKSVNANSKIQIDGEFRNYMKHDTDSITFAAADRALFTFDSVTATPLVAWKLYDASTCYVLLSRMVKTTGKFTGGYVWNDDTSSPWGTMGCVIFAPIDTMPSGLYGMALWNSDGDPVFASDRKLLKIIGAESKVIYIGDGAKTYTVTDAQNNYFILVPENVYQLQTAGGPPTWTYSIKPLMMTYTSSTSVTVQKRHVSYKNTDHAEAGTRWDHNVLLIEVAITG